MANRRKFHRIQMRSIPCSIRFRGKQHDAELIDESIEGLRIGGLGSIELQDLSRDEPIEVAVDEHVVIGRTRSVSHHNNQTFRLGLERELACQTLATGQKSERLLADFVRFSNHWITCEVGESIGADRVKIRLLDGKELETSHDQIFQLSKEDRRQSLEQNDDTFQEIQLLYQYMSPDTDFSSVDAVLRYEFSPI